MLSGLDGIRRAEEVSQEPGAPEAAGGASGGSGDFSAEEVHLADVSARSTKEAIGEDLEKVGDEATRRELLTRVTSAVAAIYAATKLTIREMFGEKM